MSRKMCRPRVGDPSSRGGDGIITASRRGVSTVVGTTAAAAGLLVSGWLVAPAADAASAPVKIMTMAAKTVSNGATVTVKPTYRASKRVKVRSASMDVRRSSSWVARGARWVKLTPGTYRVTTKVSYAVRDNGSYGKKKTTTRTQTLRVVTPPPVVPASVTSEAYRPATTPPASVTVTSSRCDSTSLRKADGAPWTCSFSDEFSGSTLDSTKWLPQQTATSGYTIGGECYVGGSNNAAVAGGVLALTVRKEAQPFLCKSPLGNYTATHTGGMVTTWASFAQAYGRFEIRAAFPRTTVPGHHGALWLYPQNPLAAFPYSGEIDIAEMYSQWSDRVIPFIHYGRLDSTVTNNYCMIQDVSAFHTYTLEWTKDTLTIAYDGKPCVTHRINGGSIELGSAPFNAPFILVLTQGLGLGGNAPTGTTPDTGTTKVDYVRVWK